MRKSTQFVILALTLPLVGFAIFNSYRVNETTRNSLAAWKAADMVVLHLASNNNEWPRDWQSLEDDFSRLYQIHEWSFDEISRRVTIDFNVKTSSLETTGSDKNPNFRVIYPSDGTDIHPDMPNPNALIKKFLKSDLNQPPSAT